MTKNVQDVPPPNRITVVRTHTETPPPFSHQTVKKTDQESPPPSSGQTVKKTDQESPASVRQIATKNDKAPFFFNRKAVKKKNQELSLSSCLIVKSSGPEPSSTVTSTARKIGYKSPPIIKQSTDKNVGYEYPAIIKQSPVKNVGYESPPNSPSVIEKDGYESPPTRRPTAISNDEDLPPFSVQPSHVPPSDVPPSDVQPSHVPPSDVPPSDVPPSVVLPPDVPPSHVPPSNVAPSNVAPSLERRRTASIIIQNKNVSDVILKLLNFNINKKRNITVTEEMITPICMQARQLFLEEPMLLTVNKPVRIVGDLHGQFRDLLHIFDVHGKPSETIYLFLGDYVDRGELSVETITLLLAFKVKHPDNVFMLRGNHEDPSINKVYGFFDECKRRYTIRLFKTFTDCYCCLPVAAVVMKRIFCCHGGLSPELKDVNDINHLPRTAFIEAKGLLCDILWSDPDATVRGWKDNITRGVSYVFGADIVQNFVVRNEFDLICRAHQVVEDGYEFFAKRQLVTVFSAPNYCGMFQNLGATMYVNEDLVISFDIMATTQTKKKGRFLRFS